MRVQHVKIGATYYTRIGQEKCLVRVVSSRLDNRVTRFTVARLCTPQYGLPKARTAASLHVRAELWGGFAEAQDTPHPSAVRNAPTRRWIGGRERWSEPQPYTSDGCEVSVGETAHDGKTHLVFRDSQGNYRAQAQ